MGLCLSSCFLSTRCAKCQCPLEYYRKDTRGFMETGGTCREHSYSSMGGCQDCGTIECRGNCNHRWETVAFGCIPCYSF